MLKNKSRRNILVKRSVVRVKPKPKPKPKPKHTITKFRTFEDMTWFNKFNQVLKEYMQYLQFKHSKYQFALYQDQSFQKMKNERPSLCMPLSLSFNLTLKLPLTMAELPDMYKCMLVISIKEERFLNFTQRIGSWTPFVYQVKGIHGKTLDLNTLKRQGILKRNLTRGEVGCYFSHVAAWQYIIEHNLPFGFIMEDDANLTDNLNIYQQLHLLDQQVALLKYEFDVLYVGHRSHAITQRILPNVSVPKSVYGCFGYIVSQQGAQKLFKNTFPIEKALDCYVADIHVQGKGIVWSAEPSVFYVVPVISQTATIR